MAITLTMVSKPQVMGDKWRTIYTIACDSSYPTGGYSVKNTDLGFASTVDPAFLVTVDNAHGYRAEYDYVNQKIVFYTSAGTQTSNATDLSAITLLRVVSFGGFRG